MRDLQPRVQLPFRILLFGTPVVLEQGSAFNQEYADCWHTVHQFSSLIEI